MPKTVILQCIVLFISLVILFNIISIIITNRKEKRISSFSLSKKDFDNTTFFEKISFVLWNIVHRVSNILNKRNYFVKSAIKYEKYILIKEEKYKSPIDYITVKILTVILFVVFYSILFVFEVLPFNIIFIILFTLVGVLLPDLIWQLLYYKKCEKISKKLYESIIIIDDNLAKTNIYNAINKVIDSLDEAISDEYQRILTDLSYNISLYQAFKRFYERTKIPELKIIYHLLNVEQEDLKLVFSKVRDEYMYIDKLNNSKNSINNILSIMKVVYTCIPLVLIMLVIIINSSYFSNVFNSIVGILSIEILFIIYLLQIITVNMIAEVKK